MTTQPAPIDMILYCPSCGMQHIDAPEPAIEHELCTQPEFPAWDNPPHRSHLCHGCGHIWRPADVPTNGVAKIQTKGRHDSPLGGCAAPQPEPVAGWKWLRDTTHDERSWPEDYSHENGSYYNTCVHCLREFVGHKRRPVCRVCAATPPAPLAPRPLALSDERIDAIFHKWPYLRIYAEEFQDVARAVLAAAQEQKP